jgi:type II secretory pathway predicted ATPase ExeA
MFLEFFGLREQPFGMTPDPAYLYASRTHGEALAQLSLGINENRGFFSLIAEPGMGKTTLLYQLLEDLRDNTQTVHVFQTQCNSREFIEYILYDLGVDASGMGLVAMHGKLNEILFETLLAGKRFVLVVDEAQNLDDSVLETVRMLSNFETHNAKLLQIILAGQPPLAEKLAQPRMLQLRQRIALRTHLEPFNTEDTGRYIAHRLKVAGFSGEPIFDPAAIRLIAWHSRGIPRNINTIGYDSMMLSYTRRQRTITADTVQEVVTRQDHDFVAPQAPAASAPMQVRLPTPAAPKPARSLSAPIDPPSEKDRQPSSFLTYDAERKTSKPRWPGRTAAVGVILLAATLLLAILGRSESKQVLSPAMFDNTSSSLGLLPSADTFPIQDSGYDAAPQDTGDGQVLTVVAGSHQSVRDLALRYIGHFDRELSEKIASLNPGLKDPDHLDPGQLIRLPLPPGAMRKANDTAEAPARPARDGAGSLFTKFTALLRERK